ncbi:MAG TPA: PP2C family protein-serine/threonine phosphatase [Terracidiphilus sp.]|nr:PP2C family protein-serine/threonine phosphatase [Terracidiphilus sp.]
MNRWNARREIFTSMPLRSFLTFCLSVAFTFASIGAVNDLFDVEHSDARRLIAKVLTSAVFAVLWIVILHRRMSRSLFIAFAAVLVVAQVSWLIALARIFPPLQRTFTSEEWRTQVDLRGLLIIGLILFSYGWFGTFFQMEGKRYFAAHTEIELASRIQQQLVPPVDLKVGNIETYGISIPSGTVGGDLIDVADSGDFVCAYVADVAGHGVAAGVLMSMVKTAVRMHFMAKPPTGEGLLEAVNNTLAPLTETSAYATFAYLLISTQTQVTYSVAAHPPIFHFQHSGGLAVRHTVENLPVAMFPDTHFETASFDFLPGDILAIVTDGLTEVFNARNKELGEPYIEQELAGLASLPLPEIAAAIFKAARAFGKTSDDQTLLLVRRTGG